MSDAPGFAPFEDVGIAERDKPPFMRLPSPETLFGLRAMRFASLAPGHQLEAYLSFLAALSRVQDAIARELPPPALPALTELRTRAANAMPLLPREELAADPASRAAISCRRSIARQRAKASWSAGVSWPECSSTTHSIALSLKASSIRSEEVMRAFQAGRCSSSSYRTKREGGTCSPAVDIIPKAPERHRGNGAAIAPDTLRPCFRKRRAARRSRGGKARRSGSSAARRAAFRQAAPAP